MHCIVLFLHAVALSLNLNLLFSEWSCILQSSIQLWPALCQRRRSWWRFEYLAQSLQHSFRSLLFHYFSVTTRNSFAGLRHLSSSRIVHFFLLHSVTNYLYPTMSHRQLHQVSNVGYRQHLRSLSSAVLDVPLWPCVQFNCSSCVETAVQSSVSLDIFRRRLKTELFERSYNWHRACQTTLLLRDSLSLSRSVLLWPQPWSLLTIMLLWHSFLIITIIINRYTNFIVLKFLTNTTNLPSQEKISVYY